MSDNGVSYEAYIDCCQVVGRLIAEKEQLQFDLKRLHEHAGWLQDQYQDALDKAKERDRKTVLDT